MENTSIETTEFPYFFVGTFIEAPDEVPLKERVDEISLLFRRDFH